MVKTTLTLLTLHVLLVVIPACSLGTTTHPTDPPELTPTTTEAAVALDSKGIPAASTSAPGSSSRPTIELTPTFTSTQVSVTSPTRCLTGPGASYPRLYTLQPGRTVQVIGRYTPGNYWIIRIPSGGTCWLTGEAALVTGSFYGLLEYLPPPTPTPALPAAPTGFHIIFECLRSAGSAYSTVHVEMRWNDAARNEDGYYIYRDGSLLATLGRDQTAFADDTSMAAAVAVGSPQPRIIYSVQSFNQAGTSTKAPKSISCFP